MYRSPTDLHALAEMLRQRKWSQAYARLESILQSRPEDAEANFLFAIAARNLKLLEEAADHLHLALHYRPDHLHSWMELASVLQDLNDPQAALSALNEAVRLDDARTELHRRLGLLQLKMGRVQAAEHSLRRAIELAPGDAYAASDLAYLLLRAHGDGAAAAALLERAIVLDPQCVNAHVNLGLVEQFQGRWQQAHAHYDRALALDPNSHEATYNRGLVRLAQGNFRHGWSDYEARTALNSAAGSRFGLPEWQKDSPSERAVLIFGEQGLGDELMFASCVPDLCAEAGQVVLYCAPRLETLFRRSFPQLRVMSGPQTGDPARLRDLPFEPELKLGIASLPARYRREASFFPGAAYLKADPKRVSRWRARLADRKGVSVGISWRGGTPRTRGEARSIALDCFLPLLQVPEVRFVSLQYGDCRSEVNALRARHAASLEYFPELEQDYEEVAALAEAVDLVLSVDTALVHLAGALGKPVWVMLPMPCEWRYMQQGDRMLWYPSVELVRQQRAGDWSPVLDDIGRRLERFVRDRCC